MNMKLHRFVAIFSIKDKRIALTDRAVIRQIKDVLRLGIGDQIILCGKDGKEITAEITHLSDNLLESLMIETRKNENEPDIDVVLYCAILKRGNFELVAQKVAEIGVKEIALLITERTVKLSFKKERIEKIIKEAAEQSGRGFVPLLRKPIKFIAALENAKNNKINFFFDQNGKPLNQLLDSARATLKEKIGVFIGPEGGWAKSEFAQAKENKFEILSLGKLTLRAETAAIIASYLCTRRFEL